MNGGESEKKGEEGLKEFFEKGEVIEGIRVNGSEFIEIKAYERLNGKVWMRNDD